MSRKITFVLIMLFLLSGCGLKAAPELQSFDGVTVATLQTPFSLMDEVSMSETVLALSGSGETPYPTALEPTYAPGDGAGMTALPSQTNVNPYLIATTEPIPLSSATPQFTLSTPPPLENSGWNGTWNIWYQNSTGTYVSSVLSIQVDDFQFSGTATINSVEYTFKGDFNIEGDEAQGKWRTSRADGNFWWQMVSPNTFLGSRDSRFGFCGDRVSTDRPDSCRKLPAN